MLILILLFLVSVEGQCPTNHCKCDTRVWDCENVNSTKQIETESSADVVTVILRNSNPSNIFNWRKFDSLKNVTVFNSSLNSVGESFFHSLSNGKLWLAADDNQLACSPSVAAVFNSNSARGKIGDFSKLQCDATLVSKYIILIEQCPLNCRCSFVELDVIKVNCSYTYATRLPAKLPEAEDIRLYSTDNQVIVFFLHHSNIFIVLIISCLDYLLCNLDNEFGSSS